MQTPELKNEALKKTGQILLLMLLLLQAGGMLFVYKMQQSFVRYEMQQVLNNTETRFQKMRISLSDYKKNKINEAEIRINQKLYDVKSVNMLVDDVELLLINDKEEENILEEIKNFFGQHNQSSSRIPDQLQELLSLDYLSPEKVRLLFIPSFIITYFSPVNLNITSHDSDISSPPPELV